MTMKNHFIDDLKIHAFARDLTYFVTCIHGKRSGMIGTYVDDLIAAGDDEFQEKVE